MSRVDVLVEKKHLKLNVTINFYQFRFVVVGFHQGFATVSRQNLLWTGSWNSLISTGTIATIWDIYDSFCDQNETPENEKADYPESTVNTSKGQEKTREKSSSSSSTVGTGNNTWENSPLSQQVLWTGEVLQLTSMSVLKPFTVLYPIYSIYSDRFNNVY